MCLLINELLFLLFRFAYCFSSDGTSAGYTFHSPQFILLISSVTSCQLPYHNEIRCLSKPTFIRATDSHHKMVKQTATLRQYKNEIWVNLSEYVHSKNNSYSVVNCTKCTTRHYRTSKLVCGVLWVQLELLVSFSFWDNKFTTRTSRETTDIVLRQWHQFSRSYKRATWISQNASIHIPDVKNTGLLGHWRMHMELHSTSWTSLRRTLGSSREIHEISFEKDVGFSCCHLRRAMHIANRDRGLSKLQNPVRPIWWSIQPNSWKLLNWWTTYPVTSNWLQ